ncbi:hypothetical protein LTR64_000907 [Lithohypha guttulata]|uniref:uncharacterized protein n=1 Tax=Lithohypha guttulata TaxID=1690604 RepID=UPI002DE0E595|nr:hypothetical protein LTR51_003101 [Lithohypha guttulata]
MAGNTNNESWMTDNVVDHDLPPTFREEDFNFLENVSFADQNPDNNNQDNVEQEAASTSSNPHLPQSSPRDLMTVDNAQSDVDDQEDADDLPSADPEDTAGGQEEEVPSPVEEDTDSSLADQPTPNLPDIATLEAFNQDDWTDSVASRLTIPRLYAPATPHPSVLFPSSPAQSQSYPVMNALVATQGVGQQGQAQPSDNTANAQPPSTQVAQPQNTTSTAPSTGSVGTGSQQCHPLPQSTQPQTLPPSSNSQSGTGTPSSSLTAATQSGQQSPSTRPPSTSTPAGTGNAGTLGPVNQSTRRRKRKNPGDNDDEPVLAAPPVKKVAQSSNGTNRAEFGTAGSVPLAPNQFTRRPPPTYTPWPPSSYNPLQGPGHVSPLNMRSPPLLAPRPPQPPRGAPPQQHTPSTNTGPPRHPFGFPGLSQPPHSQVPTFENGPRPHFPPPGPPTGQTNRGNRPPVQQSSWYDFLGPDRGGSNWTSPVTNTRADYEPQAGSGYGSNVGTGYGTYAGSGYESLTGRGFGHQSGAGHVFHPGPPQRVPGYLGPATQPSPFETYTPPRIGSTTQHPATYRGGSTTSSHPSLYRQYDARESNSASTGPVSGPSMDNRGHHDHNNPFAAHRSEAVERREGALYGSGPRNVDESRGQERFNCDLDVEEDEGRSSILARSFSSQRFRDRRSQN